MLVKVCGIKSREAAKVVSNCKADFIGCVIAPSKRRIAPKKAAEMAKSVFSGTKKVGAFVNESIDNINFIAELVGLDVIQLHGDEPANFAKKLRYPIIKAFSINQLNTKTVSTYPCDFYLIDSRSEERRVGS